MGHVQILFYTGGYVLILDRAPPLTTEAIIQVISQAEGYTSWLIWMCRIGGAPFRNYFQFNIHIICLIEWHFLLFQAS